MYYRNWTVIDVLLLKLFKEEMLSCSKDSEDLSLLDMHQQQNWTKTTVLPYSENC